LSQNSSVRLPILSTYHFLKISIQKLLTCYQLVTVKKCSLLVHKQAGSAISAERKAKIKAAYAKYTDPNVLPADRPTQTEISRDIGEAQSTVSYWFNRFKQEESGGMSPELNPGFDSKKGTAKSEGRQLTISYKEVAKAAMGYTSERAQREAQQVIIIGDTIMRLFSDLVKIALAKGVTLEEFIKEVFAFFERKTQLTAYVDMLETQLTELKELTEPNWRYKHKSAILLNFSRELLAAKTAGAKINPKKAVRALQIELDKIDEEMVT
jgi:hypothetical protein